MTPEEALAEALADRPPIADVGELVRFAGGSNSDLARIVERLPAGGELPVKGSPERTRYDNTMRSLQRYQKSGGETRGQKSTAARREFLDRLNAATAGRRATRFLRAARRRGCRVRLGPSDVVISNLAESRDPMPIVGGRLGGVVFSGGQVQRFTHADLGDTLDDLDAGRADDSGDTAVERFMAAFFEVYPAPIEVIDDVDWIHLWLDGENEPD